MIWFAGRRKAGRSHCGTTPRALSKRLAADAAAAVAVALITKTIGAVDEAARLRGDELVRKSQGAVERFVESLSRRRPLFVAFPNENRFPISRNCSRRRRQR